MKPTQKDLEMAAQAITAKGYPVLVKPCGIPGVISVTSFGTEKFMTRMACYWYITAIHEMHNHANNRSDNETAHTGH